MSDITMSDIKKTTPSDVKGTKIQDIWEEGIPVDAAFLHSTIHSQLVGAEMSLIPDKLKGATMRVDKNLQVLIISKNGAFSMVPLATVKTVNGKF